MNKLGPEVLNEHFNDLFRQGELERMVALYEPEAVVRLTNGELIAGHEQIRTYLAQLLKLHGELVAGEQSCTRCGDLAILQANWSFKGTGGAAGPVELGGRSSKVARKGMDGAWRYVIDN